MKNKLGATTVGYVNHPLERALEGIASAGLEYVELGAMRGYAEHALPEQLDREGMESLTATLQRHQLTPVSLSAHSGDLTTQEGLEYLKQCMEVASELHMIVVNTGTGQTETLEKEERFFAHIAQAAEYAEKLDITVGLETQNLMLTSGPRAIEVMERIGSPRIRLNFDPANVTFWGGERPENVVKEIAPYVVHMHVKDKQGGRGEYNFPPVGEGDIDFRYLFEVLEAAGYDGPLILEPELWREEDKSPEEVAESLRDPSMVYARPHSYLGVQDPALIDAYLVKSLTFVQDLLDSTKGD